MKKLESYFKPGSFAINKKVISFEGSKENVFELLQGQVTADLKDLESKNFIQSCLCDEKGFIKAEFLLSNENGLEILVDESCLSILLEELSKFIKFYNLEMEINSREVFYKFFKKRNSTGYIFSNNMLFCDIEFKENGHEKLLTEAEFDLNILLMGQFLFNYQDVGKHRPHDVGMNESHVSFLKGCFRGQEVIARTEHLSKKKKEIISIKAEDEASIKSKKIKTLKEVSFEGSTFKLISFIPD